MVKPLQYTPFQTRLIDPIFAFTRELVNGRIANPAFDIKQFQIGGPPDFGHDFQPGNLSVDDKVFAAFKGYVAARRDVYKLSEAQLEREREVIKRLMRYDLATAAYGIYNADRLLIADDPQLLKAVEVLPHARDLAAKSTP